MNKNAIPFAVVAVLLSLVMVIGSCSKLKDDVTPTAPQAGIHGPGWSDTTSASFHGKVLKQQHYDVNTCITCHERAFQNQGGGTSGKSCYKCHSSFPHPAEWAAADTANARFHGKFLRLISYSLNDCAKCHGAAFDGGTSGKACGTCHSSFPHGAGWTNPASPGYHGKYLKARNYQTQECQSCHGSAYTGGTSNKSCFTCHASYPHAAGWLATSSDAYHGKYLKNKNWNSTECKTCHGAGYDGGTSNKSCFTCHASYPHETKFTPPGRHIGYLQIVNYPLPQCQTCHGTGYTGGAITNVTCARSGCHVDRTNTAKSPEACNTCHGDFGAAASNFLSSAPPKSVLGDSSTSAPGVGAHARHLVNGSLGRTVKCTECHTVPSAWNSSGHLGALPAEVIMNDTLARTVSGGGTIRPSPIYSAASNRCDNSYCHGNWKLIRSRALGDPYNWYVDSVMTGNNVSPAWTGGANEVLCGTACHGAPPTGHRLPAGATCATCHFGVVDAAGNIIDRTKHVNGRINVYGIEYSFR